MYKTQCFLSIIPSKRQFTLLLLFEIPSGSLIKYGVQKTSGKKNSCLKKKGNGPLWLACRVYDGIRIKTEEKRTIYLW